MDESYPRDMRVLTGQAGSAVSDFLSITGAEFPQEADILPGPHNPTEFAQKLYAYESLNPPVIRTEREAEPYSLQWFLNIESQRHSRHGRWIPRLLEFAKHSGETLLGLGNGLGTDWLQYARHNADVIVCSPSASQLGLIRRNFELRGLAGRFIHAHPTSLPLESASIDVACISSLIPGSETEAMVDQVYRVLKPGGKVLAVTRALYDVDFWFSTLFFWARWLGYRPPSKASRAQCTTGRKLKQLFSRFIEHRIHKRQLRRSEVPHMWRFLPLPVLARLMGRILVLKAFKPLSAAINVQAAVA
jgi:ubiquinone/menaquinone biosynthesis C-methylase UbiE